MGFLLKWQHSLGKFLSIGVSWPGIGPEGNRRQAFLIVKIEWSGVIGPGIPDGYRPGNLLGKHMDGVSPDPGLGPMEYPVFSGDGKAPDIPVFIACDQALVNMYVMDHERDIPKFDAVVGGTRGQNRFVIDHLQGRQAQPLSNIPFVPGKHVVGYPDD